MNKKLGSEAIRLAIKRQPLNTRNSNAAANGQMLTASGFS